LELSEPASRKKNVHAGRWEPTVFWLMLLFVGVSGLYTDIFHLAWPAQTAASTSGALWALNVAPSTTNSLHPSQPSEGSQAEKNRLALSNAFTGPSPRNG
jgi:hypothetical protein